MIVALNIIVAILIIGYAFLVYLGFKVRAIIRAEIADINRRREDV